LWALIGSGALVEVLAHDPAYRAWGFAPRNSPDVPPAIREVVANSYAIHRRRCNSGRDCLAKDQNCAGSGLIDARTYGRTNIPSIALEQLHPLWKQTARSFP
jgi:hypothetical protein